MGGTRTAVLWLGWALVAGCGDDSGDTHPSTAGIANIGSGGSGGSAGVSGSAASPASATGGGGGAVPPFNPFDPIDVGGADPCPGSVGVVSASLDAGPFVPSELTVFDLATVANAPTSPLVAYDQSLLIPGAEGFWEVSPDGTQSWFDAQPDGHPVAFHVADLDGDGDGDLVLVSDGSDPDGTTGTHVAVWERLGPRSWARVARVPPDNWGDDLTPLALADVDGDAKVDLVAPAEVFRGDGALGFGAATTFTAPGESKAIALFDATGDGRLDVAVYSVLDGASFVDVLTGDGKGGFGDPHRSMLEITDGGPGAFGDMTGDGVPDLVLWQAQDNSQAGLYLSQGRASSTSGANTFELSAARQLATADGIGARPPVLVDVDGDAVLETFYGRNDGIAIVALNGAGEPTTREVEVPFGAVMSLVTGHGDGGGAPTAYLLLSIACRAPCGATCAGECFLGGCALCTSDLDCPGSRCTTEMVSGAIGPQWITACAACTDCDDAGVDDADGG